MSKPTNRGNGNGNSLIGIGTGDRDASETTATDNSLTATNSGNTDIENSGNTSYTINDTDITINIYGELPKDVTVKPEESHPAQNLETIIDAEQEGTSIKNIETQHDDAIRQEYSLAFFKIQQVNPAPGDLNRTTLIFAAPKARAFNIYAHEAEINQLKGGALVNRMREMGAYLHDYNGQAAYTREIPVTDTYQLPSIKTGRGRSGTTTQNITTWKAEAICHYSGGELHSPDQDTFAMQKYNPLNGVIIRGERHNRGELHSANSFAIETRNPVTGLLEEGQNFIHGQDVDRENSPHIVRFDDQGFVTYAKSANPNIGVYDTGRLYELNRNLGNAIPRNAFEENREIMVLGAPVAP